MNIAVWGAGKFGVYVTQQLTSNPNVSIKCIIDMRADELDAMFGIPVINPTKFREDFADIVDVVLVAFVNSIADIKHLKRLGAAKLGVISDLVYRFKSELNDNILDDRQIIWIEDIDENLPMLSTLETNVVDYCNLNCKGCSHFSNIYPEGSKVAFDVFKEDVSCLSKKINIIQFNLLGGEALLSEDLEDYIRCIVKYMPATKIFLVTNGILIPRQTPERMQFLAENKVVISITEYPPTVQMREKIRETLERYNVYFEVRQPVLTFGKNIDVSGTNDPWVAQSICRESSCHFLREGKIYKCPFSALGNYFFEHYSIPLHFEEGIDIYNKENDWETIIHNLEKTPIEQCRFCGAEEQFQWTISMNPQKEEWMI